MEHLIVGILGVVAVVAVNALAPKVRIAAPLLLVMVGIAVSFLPFVSPIEVNPEVVLAGFLPPLLYASAVGLPTMEFRRDFRTISILSVLLVLVSTAVVGLLMNAIVPGIGLAVGMALGAILSPTDAVATSIVRNAGVSRRLVIMLEGESLLNDATALVLLRSAIVAMAATVAAAHIAVDFLYAVVVAVVIGFAVGRMQLWVRSHVHQPASSVAVSLVVPFVAYVPTQLLGASGLVAAAAAGLVSGHGATTYLTAQDRMTERAVWRTLEMLLESAVFLLMGLELLALIDDVRRERDTELFAVVLGLIAVLAILVVRAAFIAFSLWRLARRARRSPQIRQWIESAQQRSAGADLKGDPARGVHGRLTRRLADLDYLAAEALGWREGVLLVWAGMRGAVTLAAAQSLPSDTPHRPLLVLTAFVVAVGTLLVQGGTLGFVARALGLTERRPTANQQESEAMQAELRAAVADRIADPELRRPDGTPYDPEVLARAHTQMTKALDASGPTRPDLQTQYGALRLEMIIAQRAELIRLRDLGTYSTALLTAALDRLDAEQIGLELRSDP